MRARKPYQRKKSSTPHQNAVTTIESALPDLQPVGHSQDRDRETQVVTAVVANPSNIIRPIFAGTGGYGDILKIVPTKKRHFEVPAELERPLDPTDLAYLKGKGCFDLPSDSTALVEAYFLYVHSWFPILNGPAICRECVEGRVDGINLLLLWSMFSIAASYVPGYSHHSTKRDFVARASLLFHLAPENDKSVLVQSALLLSFWFDEAEDIKQSWYWSGIAFSIAQSLGLHHDYEGPTREEEALRRDLWRACMYRDVWLSFGMGRPLRLHASDCSVKVLPDSDFTFRYLTMVENAAPLFDDEGVSKLFKNWQYLNKLSNALRKMISSQSPQIPQLDDMLEAPYEDSDGTEPTLPIYIAEQHLRLHHLAAKMAYYGRRREMDRAARTAEASASVITGFISNEHWRYVAPVVIPLVVPAITFDLEQHRSRTGSHSDYTMKIVLQFLEKIGHTYPAASILSRLTSAAYTCNPRNQRETTP